MVFTGKSLQADQIDDVIPFLIQVESGGRADAVSPRGAVGLMQITPVVLHELFDEYDFVSIIPTLYPDGTKIYGVYWSEISLVQTYDKEIPLPIVGRTGYTLLDERFNKACGRAYLRRLSSHYLKDIEIKYGMNIPCHGEVGWCEKKMRLGLILAAYNWGVGNLRKVDYNLNRCPESVKEYIRKILKLYEKSQSKRGIYPYL